MIPIIGQPEIQDIFFGVQVKCPCKRVIVVLVPGTPKVCPDCGRPFQMLGFPTMQEKNGQVGVNCPLQMGAPTKETK